MLCLLSSMSAQVYSQVEDDLNSNPVAEAESQFLFINMLEFLGEFETDAGEWVSPDILGNDAFADLDAVNTNSEGTNARGERQVMSAADNESDN
jgi:hypothetical protein